MSASREITSHASFYEVLSLLTRRFARLSLIVILFVNSPETKGGVWIVALFYGLGIGATYPMQRTFYMLIIPAGQETEMIGLFQFCR